MSRRKMGLPEAGFIFCCFNTVNKITPREFDIWMRLLQKVKGSVLWLKKSSNLWLETQETDLLVKSALENEAKKRNVNPSRLIFQGIMSEKEYLASHKLADLFLDTFNFNAQSTGCYALWAGLPLITKKGEQCVARSAASYLNAIGLPELIVKTDNEYEELALELATNKRLLASLKEKLWKNRKTTPLFDTKTYTRNLEQAFENIHINYKNGHPPKDLIL